MKKFLYMALFLVGPMLFSHPHAYGADSKEAATNWTTEKKTVGEVTITATFRNPEDIWDPGYLIFYVQLDSDTKNLDDLDFDKDIVLRDDNEWTYLPQMIEKSGSGRHREAVLRFLRSKRRPEYIELVVRKIDGASGTVFKWWSMRTM